MNPVNPMIPSSGNPGHHESQMTIKSHPWRHRARHPRTIDNRGTEIAGKLATAVPDTTTMPLASNLGLFVPSWRYRSSMLVHIPTAFLD